MIPAARTELVLAEIRAEIAPRIREFRRSRQEGQAAGCRSLEGAGAGLPQSVTPPSCLPSDRLELGGLIVYCLAVWGLWAIVVSGLTELVRRGWL